MKSVYTHFPFEFRCQIFPHSLFQRQITTLVSEPTLLFQKSDILAPIRQVFQAVTVKCLLNTF
jgi:hypothetical protein